MRLCISSHSSRDLCRPNIVVRISRRPQANFTIANKLFCFLFFCFCFFFVAGLTQTFYVRFLKYIHTYLLATNKNLPLFWHIVLMSKYVLDTTFCNGVLYAPFAHTLQTIVCRHTISIVCAIEISYLFSSSSLRAWQLCVFMYTNDSRHTHTHTHRRTETSSLFGLIQFFKLKEIKRKKKVSRVLFVWCVDIFHTLHERRTLRTNVVLNYL